MSTESLPSAADSAPPEFRVALAVDGDQLDAVAQLVAADATHLAQAGAEIDDCDSGASTHRE